MYERFKNFTVLIMKINRSIHKIKTEEMAEFELKSPHVSCLYYLHQESALMAKELCDICGEDKASVSRSLVYLETNGYIVCDSNAKKRYKATFTLTEKGAEVAARIAKKIDCVLEPASEGISEENRAILYRSLTLINDNLEKICKNYGE